jgi:hypothetical protein
MKQPSGLPRLPKSVPEFLAYQLARRLDDDDHLAKYIELAKTRSVAFLLQVYRSADEGSKTIRDRRNLFWHIIGRSIDEQ